MKPIRALVMLKRRKRRQKRGGAGLQKQALYHYHVFCVIPEAIYYLTLANYGPNLKWISGLHTLHCGEPCCALPNQHSKHYKPANASRPAQIARQEWKWAAWELTLGGHAPAGLTPLDLESWFSTLHSSRLGKARNWIRGGESGAGGIKTVVRLHEGPWASPASKHQNFAILLYSSQTWSQLGLIPVKPQHLFTNAAKKSP